MVCNYQSSQCKNLTIQYQQLEIDLNNRSRYLFHLYLVITYYSPKKSVEPQVSHWFRYEAHFYQVLLTFLTEFSHETFLASTEILWRTNPVIYTWYRTCACNKHSIINTWYRTCPSLIHGIEHVPATNSPSCIHGMQQTLHH